MPHLFFWSPKFFMQFETFDLMTSKLLENVKSKFFKTWQFQVGRTPETSGLLNSRALFEKNESITVLQKSLIISKRIFIKINFFSLNNRHWNFGKEICLPFRNAVIPILLSKKPNQTFSLDTVRWFFALSYKNPQCHCKCK